MDPFTQRMLERAKARREKLDTQLSNAGHDVKIRHRASPLKDSNSSNLVAFHSSPVSSQDSPKSLRDSTSQESSDSVKNFVKTPQKEKKRVLTIEKEHRKENTEQTNQVRSKLHRLGQLYSDDSSQELSSPIHRNEERFTAEDAPFDNKNVKRGARLDRLAALASEINNWEDDLSHPTLQVKKGESKAEKIQQKMNEQVKAGTSSSEPQPSTSGYGRWKSNADIKVSNNSNSPTRQLKWDKTVLENLEAQGYTRTKSNSRLVYDYKACSQDPKQIKKNSSPNGKTQDAKDKKEASISTSEGKISTSEQIGTRNRFGGYGSPQNKHSPGSVLSKASIFENKSLATRCKDPAEMTLTERMALFERNKGEALIPKAPLTLSVPAKKLMEQREKPTTNVFSDQRQRNAVNKSVSSNRALFEQGLPKQELENDIMRDCQTERQKELEMLRSRFNKNKENAQAAAGSCIRPRKNSEPTTTSPKNSPVCPVKPTPATDYVPPAPPLPSSPMTPASEPIQTRGSSGKRQVSAATPPQSSNFFQNRPSIYSEVKRIKVHVSPPKPGNIYPDLTGIETTTTTETETETTDSEYTLGTTEPETATCDEYDDDQDEESNFDEIGNSSFESSILRAVTRQSLNKKRTIEPSDADSSTSDISVLDEMNEYLDECLAYQEISQHSHGPTPPKLNRAGESPSMTSNSFKYTQGSAYRSPLTVTPKSSPKRDPFIVDGNSRIPLMHSVSSYRRQQSQTPKTPIKSISRTVEVSSDYEYNNSSEKQEATLVQEKIKSLMDDVCKQQTVIGQSSQALNLCSATVEFSGSREQVEGERLLLVATHRRQAALNEIQRLKVEGTLRPTVPGDSGLQESGSLTISAITLPLNKDHVRNADRDICLHFLCLVRHLDTIIATPIVQAEPGDSCIRFPSTLKLDNLYSDFKITIEVYSLETRVEILPHEVKYHIHNGGHCNGSNNTKKGANKTPKKFLKQDSRLVMPSVQSPAGPSAVRSPAFSLSGYVVFSLKEVNRQQFTLNKIPRNSPLEGRLQMHVSCELSVSIEHRGFLTMFEDISGFGAWHRRWCLLKGDTLSYWKYPEDEKKKTPIGSLELQGVATKNVGLVVRDICARPNTFLLETVRPAEINDVDSLTVVRNGSSTTIRHLISADTKEERLEWCSKLNQTLSLIRAWGGMSPALP